MRISDWSSDVCSSDLEGRREVDVRCDRLRLARPKARRIANQERHLQRFLVDEPLVEPAMLAEKEALIRGVDDDGIFRDAVLVEPVEQPADILVDRHDGAQVALDVALVLEVVQLLPRSEEHTSELQSLMRI